MKRSDLVAGLKFATTMFLFAFLVVLASAYSAVAGELVLSKPAEVSASQAQEPPDDSSDNRPIIRFDQEKVDLGKVAQGDIAEHVFSVYNDGVTPLKILKLKPG